MHDAVANRLRMARADTKCSQAEFAPKVGLSLSALKRIELGHNVPSGETLLGYARLGFSPSWILTGDGAMLLRGSHSGVSEKGTTRGDARPTAAPAFEGSVALDDDLFRAVRKLVAQVHADERVRLPQEALFEEVVRWYKEVWARGEDSAERLTQMGWLETRLRKELQAARTEPGTGKRSV